MFTFNPSLASGEDDLEEGDESLDVRNLGKDPEQEEELQFDFKEIDMAKLMEDYVEVDTSNVTIANADRLQQLKDDLDLQSAKATAAAAAAAAADDKEDGTEEAQDDAEGATAVDIDEALFDGDDEDLDELEEELEDLTVA
ncbi:hypothetical protein E2C01_040051 [Portunus trituberculatus]|uniref:Uncharacterized protein n=2 Tax=Portunus trituberculatus TaxID=210409 RepID=A0A5B7FPP0_PORTR|nr:hypothetical protein [Portunus trituberculatus]